MRVIWKGSSVSRPAGGAPASPQQAREAGQGARSAVLCCAHLLLCGRLERHRRQLLPEILEPLLRHLARHQVCGRKRGWVAGKGLGGRAWGWGGSAGRQDVCLNHPKKARGGSPAARSVWPTAPAGNLRGRKLPPPRTSKRGQQCAEMIEGSSVQERSNAHRSCSGAG